MIQWMAARKAASMWWPAVVGAVVIAGPAFLLGQCSGAAHQTDKQEADQIGAIERAGKANETAAGERAASTSNITAAQQERSDAIQTAPDQRPSPGRLARACVQLRQQGTPPDRLPANCRP